MKTKKIIIGALVGTIVYFLLGIIVYSLLFKDIYRRENLNHTMLFEFFGCLFFGTLVAFIFTKWADITNWWTGAKAGAVIGLLYSASQNFFMFSGLEINYQNIFLDIALNMVMIGIVGAAIAFMKTFRQVLSIFFLAFGLFTIYAVFTVLPEYGLEIGLGNFILPIIFFILSYWSYPKEKAK